MIGFINGRGLVLCASLLAFGSSTALAHGHRAHRHAEASPESQQGATSASPAVPWVSRCLTAVKTQRLRAHLTGGNIATAEQLARLGLELHAAVLQQGPRRHGSQDHGPSAPRIHGSAGHGVADGHGHGHSHGHGHAHNAAGDDHAGRMRGAQACATAALAIEPHYSEALYLKGLARLDAHDFAAALALARAVLKQDSRHVGALLLASDALLERGELVEAMSAVERALALKPTAAVLIRAAHLSHRLGDDASAKQLYARVIRDGLRSDAGEMATWAAIEAAKIFLVEGDAAGAEAGFALALRVDPRAREAWVGQAQACLQQGKRRCAKTAVQKATALSAQPALPMTLRPLLASAH